MKRIIITAAAVLLAYAALVFAASAQSEKEPGVKQFPFSASTASEWDAAVKKVNEAGRFVNVETNCKAAGDRIYCVADAVEECKDCGR